VNIGSPVNGYDPKKVVGTNAKKRETAQTAKNDRHLLRFIGCPNK
jgi:hypothetical protein